MKKHKTVFRKILSFVLSAAMTASVAAAAAVVTSASGINPAEQRILDELNTSVSLNGKTRTIPYRYIDQARFWFDTVTCISDEDADVIIAKIEEAKNYIEEAGVDNFSDLSDEQISHLVGIANDASSSCGLVLGFFLDRLSGAHHLDVSGDTAVSDGERISLGEEDRMISAEVREQIKEELGITGFIMQDIPGSPALSDTDGDGIWTGKVTLKDIPSDMITELTSDGTHTGKYGICFRIASENNEHLYWSDYESSDERTCCSSTELCADAKQGDSIVLNVRLDTTRISRYASTPASQLGSNAYTLWDTSFSTEKYISAESIELDKDKITLDAGSSEKLSAVILPEDTTDMTVSWSSSDESVASVSDDGTVSAVAPGETVITAETENGLSAQCTVTVENPLKEVESITLSNKKLTLLKGETGTLSARLTPEDAYDKTVTWTSSDDSVAAVEEGLVNAVGEGMAIITATASNGKAASCFVTVEDPVIDIENISLDRTSVELETGESTSIGAVIAPENATDKTVFWTSSNSGIVRVSDGQITALRAGKAIITATAVNGKAASCFVAVRDPYVPVTEVTADKEKISLETGKTAVITATVLPENATDKKLVWSSDDPSVASVSDGTVTAVSEGTATITAESSNGISASVTVTVTSPFTDVTGVKINKKTLKLTPGEVSQLSAEVIPSDATNKTIKWSSTDISVAKVSKGKVTAVSAGTAIIYAKAYNGLYAVCRVTVEPPFIDVVSIKLSSSSAVMNVGGSINLSATVLPDNATDKTVLWSSSRESVATVSGGKVTAKAAGSAVITAKTKNGKTASCTVTVNVPPEKITLNKTSVTVYKGNTVSLTASVAPSDAYDKTVSWSSSDRSVATVSNGKITAVKPGSAVITAATVNGKTAKCTVTVKKYVAPTGIKLSRNALTLGKGEPYNVTATVLPSDASNKNVTWSTGNSKVAVVTNGKITAVSNGTTTITAKTANGKTASCTITVKNAPSKITVTKSTLTLGVGESYKLGSMIDSNSSCSKRTFRTSNSGIVKMTRTDWQGEFVAVKPGVAYVTVRTYNGKESSCKVTVREAPAKVSLSSGLIKMKVGQKSSVFAVVSSGAGCATRTYRSSNSSIVKMTRTNWQGEFTAMKKGTAYVTVRTYNGKEASCKIVVS